MPLIIEGSQIPPRWLERKPSASVVPSSRRAVKSDHLRIALINNIPDPALEDTEIQFLDLLDAASGDLPVLVQLFSLPGVPRSDRGMAHVRSFYFDLNHLWNSRFDALIMTGTEPKCADLRLEPYWPNLTEVLEWAETNTASTVLSCLAAHAGVLHSDGIHRHPEADKRFGVFEFTKLETHQLTAGEAHQVRFPHSRWNEVRADALKEHGYQVLTGSDEAGVDLFVKQKKGSLFVHFQGHPEYGAETLFKEYRRDIRRFLQKERETYPSMPKGYFDEASAQLLTSFRESVESERREELMEGFPEAILVGRLHRTWQSSATAIYSNWFCYLLSRRQNASRSRAHGLLSRAVHREPVETVVLGSALR
jgi:homoserine O-succinyltransferase/O-acetyltransferase